MTFLNKTPPIWWDSNRRKYLTQLNITQAKAGIERKFFDSGFFMFSQKYFFKPRVESDKTGSALFISAERRKNLSPLFTTKPVDQLFEQFMKHRPNFKHDTPEGNHILAQLDAEKK